VRDAAETFLDVVEDHVTEFPRVDATPTPRIGRVRFYVRTFDGTLGMEAMEEDLGRNLHALSPVYHAGHAVITAIRETSERQP
jgi:hypothetical protein